MHVVCQQQVGQKVKFVFWKVHFQNDWSKHQESFKIQIFYIVIKTVEKRTGKFVWK